MEPKRVGAVVDRVLGDLGLAAVERASRVAQRWEEAAGSEAARHSRPLALRRGVLEVEVDSSVWSQELQLRREEILERLRCALGDEAPSGLHLRVGSLGR